MYSLLDLHSQIDEALAINSIESTFSPEYYTDLINGQREVWIRNEYNKNRSIDPYLLQVLPCISLELTNPIECCTTVPDGCKILRSVEEIPNTLEFYYNKGIVSVGPADIIMPRFTLIDYSRVPYIGYGRTTSRFIYTFLYNKRLYVISKDTSYLLLKKITIQGLFTDPTSLGSFINCETSGACWKPSDPYPLNSWMWEYMKPLILQQLMQKMALPQDEMNDADDNKIDRSNGNQ